MVDVENDSTVGSEQRRCNCGAKLHATVVLHVVGGVRAGFCACILDQAERVDGRRCENNEAEEGQYK